MNSAFLSTLLTTCWILLFPVADVLTGSPPLSYVDFDVDAVYVSADTVCVRWKAPEGRDVNEWLVQTVSLMNEDEPTRHSDLIFKNTTSHCLIANLEEKKYRIVVYSMNDKETEINMQGSTEIDLLDPSSFSRIPTRPNWKCGYGGHQLVDRNLNMTAKMPEQSTDKTKVLRLASIVAGSIVGAIILVAIVMAIHNRKDRSRSTDTSTRKQSARSLPQLDEPSGKNGAVVLVGHSSNSATSENQAIRNADTHILSVPGKSVDRNKVAFSVASWGSEFDALEENHTSVDHTVQPNKSHEMTYTVPNVFPSIHSYQKVSNLSDDLRPLTPKISIHSCVPLTPGQRSDGPASNYTNSSLGVYGNVTPKPSSNSSSNEHNYCNFQELSQSSSSPAPPIPCRGRML